MITVSAAFLAALRGPHSIAVRVTGYPPGSSTGTDIPVVGGTVTLDRTAVHRRHAVVQLADPSSYPSAPSAPASVYGGRFKVERGIRHGDGSIEYVSLGIYRTEDASRDKPATQVQLEGWGLSMQVADERFTEPRVVTGAPLNTDAIETLINEPLPSSVVSVPVSSSGTLPDPTVIDRDRWQACLDWAQAIGYEVFDDSAAGFVIQPVPDPTTAASVWVVDVGATGVLVSAADQVSRTGVPNGIVALGEPADPAVAPVQALVTDDNSSSPAKWGGPYGRVPRFITSPYILTTDQATAAAGAALADLRGRVAAIDFSAVPNPALEAGDAITVRYDDHNELHLIDTLDIPLSVDQPMQGTTRATELPGE